MKIASQVILAQTAGPLSETQELSFLTHNEQRFQEIDGLTGLSPELLHRIGDITSRRRLKYGINPELQSESHAQKATTETLDERLDALVQCCSDNGGVSSVMGRVVMDTAESYRIATILYLRCSISG
jgi:hypothetical protein